MYDLLMFSLLFLILIIQFFILYFDVKDGEETRETSHQNTHEEEEVEHLSVRESVYLREKEYDERITKMKAELALKNVRMREESVADEGEGVHNLPHDIIREAQYDYLPDVEESE